MRLGSTICSALAARQSEAARQRRVTHGVLAAILVLWLAMTPSAHAASGDWPTWQHDLSGSRFSDAERTLTASSVPRLVPRWAFAFPGADAASSQPAVVENTLYVGGRDGRFYALDATTGATKWVFDTATVAGPGQNQLRDGPAVADGTVFFGDSVGYLYALDAATGALRWASRVQGPPSQQTTYTRGVITSSPLVWHGMVYVGIASNEETSATDPVYECCVFRGSVIAVDARSGKTVWQHFTVDKPQPAGINAFGLPRYAPSGGGIWSSPAIDPAAGTLVVATGNAYSGNPSGADSVTALSATTGQLRWSRQMTAGDSWNFSCDLPGSVNCPTAGPDFDFGSSPNLFVLRTARRVRHGSGWRLRRRSQAVVGIGQKSGAFFLLDERTGRTIWARKLVETLTAGETTGNVEGVKWGSSFDGRRIYASVSYAPPGRLYALDPATGQTLWSTPNPSDGCSSGGGAQYARTGDCELAMPGAATSSPGVVFEGSLDGKIRAFSSATGRILWQYDTVRTFQTTNGLLGNGGSISGGGAVVTHGLLYVSSGYNLLDLPGSGMHGNVLLAFGLPSSAPEVHTAPERAVTKPPSAALHACVSAWNGAQNRASQGLLTRRLRDGRAPTVRASLLAADAECMMTIQLEVSAHHLWTIHLSLVRGRFVIAPERDALAPLASHVWTLRASRDGTVAVPAGH